MIIRPMAKNNKKVSNLRNLCKLMDFRCKPECGFLLY